MVEFDKYIMAIIDDNNNYPLTGFFYDNMDDIYDKSIDNNQIITLTFKGDNVDNKKRIIIYKYDFVNGKQTRFVIKLGKFTLYINKQDNEYSSIEMFSMNESCTNCDVVFDVRFDDNHFILGKYKENEVEIKKTCSLENALERIDPIDWNLNYVLDEMSHAVNIAYEDEEWKKDSEMLFNFLRPALSLAVMDTRMAWEEYNLMMERLYRSKLVIIDNGFSEQAKSRSSVEAKYNKFKSTREILEGQREESKRK